LVLMMVDQPFLEPNVDVVRARLKLMALGHDSDYRRVVI
jgi:hypothetical protein